VNEHGHQNHAGACALRSKGERHRGKNPKRNVINPSSQRSEKKAMQRLEKRLSYASAFAPGLKLLANYIQKEKAPQQEKPKLKSLRLA
jgi:hypothetical protein